ncbi:MAG: hypothetical protein COA42_11670 [Alteromonadaceae bacterium]|nr:MAG: hypothetical protein COA42_11670 [Alteromonadaceae bacterium]
MNPADALKYLAKALKKGSDVRSEIISEVNNLSSAIASACIYTSMRLNQALIADDLNEKRKILVSMETGEIESHARMNGMCAPVFHAANELKRFYSDENLNRSLGKKDELLALFNALKKGEMGMQQFMMDFINITDTVEGKSAREIDSSIREHVKKLQGLAKSAQYCQFTISTLL